MLKRTFLTGLVLLLGTLSYLGCGKSDQESQTQETQAVASMNIEKVTLDVQGMTCSGCEYNVESALKKIDGVTKVNAAFTQHSAEVEFDPEAATVAQLVQAVNGIGYTAKEQMLN